jgi:lipopolysaccharide assembly outer membrane protein LptD (OstA)
MKSLMLILGSVLLAYTLLAQTTPSPSQEKIATAGYTAKNGSNVETGMLAVRGREITKSDSITRCHGDCEMTIHDVILKADELDLHASTGDVEARGNVRVKLLPQSVAVAH